MEDGTAPAAPLASDPSGTTLLTIVGLGLLAAWAVSLLLHPYTVCGSCKGTPRSYGAAGRAASCAPAPGSGRGTGVSGACTPSAGPG
ncbi:hypothetical protein FHX44_112231 [Pseudonocardia hierapolitana]|uniref:Uncharacterized protein n=1 Tax=Pseudonocardia hierapolitana TaxID=1128676 RepID=A0A561SNA3_9PSEU|nr:hypothetical protein FHX44_112231 [Pseudonocardia hierapolitana]